MPSILVGVKSFGRRNGKDSEKIVSLSRLELATFIYLVSHSTAWPNLHRTYRRVLRPFTQSCTPLPGLITSYKYKGSASDDARSLKRAQGLDNSGLLRGTRKKILNYSCYVTLGMRSCEGEGGRSACSVSRIWRTKNGGVWSNYIIILYELVRRSANIKLMGQHGTKVLQYSCWFVVFVFRILSFVVFRLLGCVCCACRTQYGGMTLPSDASPSLDNRGQWKEVRENINLQRATAKHHHWACI